MKLVLDQASGALLVRAYGPREFVIGDQTYRGPVVIAGSRVLVDVLPPSVSGFGTEHVELLCALGADIFLIGTGGTHCFLPAAVTAGFLSRGLGCEVMTTAAACRSHHVLVSESRSVIAALFPIEGT